MTKNDVVKFIGENRKKIILGATALAGGALLIGGGKTVKRSIKAVQNNAKDMDLSMDFGVLPVLKFEGAALKDLGVVGETIFESFNDVNPNTKFNVVIDVATMTK